MLRVIKDSFIDKMSGETSIPSAEISDCGNFIRKKGFQDCKIRVLLDDEVKVPAVKTEKKEKEVKREDG